MDLEMSRFLAGNFESSFFVFCFCFFVFYLQKLVLSATNSLKRALER